jgi:lipoyl(octanoyl) transferase
MLLLSASLGLTPYADALELQRRAARARISGELAEDLLILVEHPPVVTLGRSTKAQHLTSSAELLASHGVELFDVERGGDVTFHGPGQLVGYPIFDLKRHKRDLHWYLRQVEESLIVALAEFGVTGERVEKYTGVWTSERGEGSGERGGSASSVESASPRAENREPRATAVPPLPAPRSPLRKLASIGVHARDWVTWHGFALNVATDLRFFDLIVPCGIAGVEMTSVSRELSRALEVPAVEAAVVRGFESVFGLAAQPADESVLALLQRAEVAAPTG